MVLIVYFERQSGWTSGKHIPWLFSCSMSLRFEIFRLVPSLLLKLRLQFKTLDSFIIKDGNMQAKEQSFAASQWSKIRRKVQFRGAALFSS